MDPDPLPSTSPVLNLLLLTIDSIHFTEPENWAVWIVIVSIALLCLVVSAFVSGSEIAYFGLTSSDIESLSGEKDNPSSRKAFALISDSERLLATILISNNLVNIMMVVLLTFALNQTVHITDTLLNLLLLTVFQTFLLLLFGEIFPKLVARTRPMAWARVAAAPLTLLFNIFGPLARIMVKSTGLVNKIVTKRTSHISTDELEKALEISDIKDGQDKEMLEGILSFGEKEVGDVMVSRVDVTLIDIKDSWNKVVDTVVKSGYSRIPVYDDNPDAIKGVLYSKDMLPYIGNKDDSFRWQSLIRGAYFVPESKMIDDLLEDFRTRKIHIAIVIDEYGGTQGIVTLEDIIEEIVGDIDDEYDDEEKLFKRVSSDTFIFEGKIPLNDFLRVTGVEEDEIGDIGDAETLAGLILAIKGDFPKEKESIEYGRLRFLVLGIQKHRIISVRVKIMPAEKSGEESDD